MEVGQKILEECTGVLLIRELPDTVKLKETEAEAYCAVWDIMVETGEKSSHGICILWSGYPGQTGHAI